jgi:transcription initiation factor IIE alpha subunit
MTARAPDWVDVISHFTGCFSAVSILAAMQLDLFTPLRNGPRTYEELASELAVDPRRLRMLLSTLASTKLVTLRDGPVANSPLAAEMRRCNLRVWRS